MTTKNPVPKESERRRFARIPRDNITYVSECNVLEELSLRDESEKLICRMKDISAGGLLFESPKEYPLGAILKLELVLPHWEKYKKSLFRSQFAYPSKPFLVLARVVRVEYVEEGVFDIGVSFTGVDDSTRELLSDYVNSLLPKAE
jgi:hypothetical protein